MPHRCALDSDAVDGSTCWPSEALPFASSSGASSSSSSPSSSSSSSSAITLARESSSFSLFVTASRTLTALCALGFLLLALRLGLQGSRRRALSQRGQLLAAWAMCHLALQYTLAVFGWPSTSLLSLANQLMLCLAVLAAASGDWWLAALANFLPAAVMFPCGLCSSPPLTASSRRASIDPIVVPTSSGSDSGSTSSGVPAPLPSAASHNRNLLRLAKARLSQLDAEYARTVEESTQKGAFMAFLAHELRNPLQVITANTDFLLEEANQSNGSPRSDDDSEGGPVANGGSNTLSVDQRELITSVNSSAELMLSIVNDVLDASRLQSGRMAFERLPIDLHFICHSILNISRSQAAAKGLRLTLHIDDAVPRFVISDPTRIHQLLLNLISNAIKFTTEGGVTLTLHAQKTTPLEQQRLAADQEADGLVTPAADPPGVHTSPIGLLRSETKFSPSSSDAALHGLADVSPLPVPTPALGADGHSAYTASGAVSPADDTVPESLSSIFTAVGVNVGPPPILAPSVVIELDVSDTGSGIAPEHLGKLFQPYSQATLGTQREHGGTGLGLSICTQIVKLMRGRIDVTSQLGKGSTFHCRLVMEACDDEAIRRGLGTAGSFSDSPDLRGVKSTSHSRTSSQSDSSRPRSSRRRGGNNAPALERVLVVDDHEVNCKLLARMVTSLGFACDVAHDGLEAVEMLRVAKAQLEASDASGVSVATAGYMCAFLDLNMPRCDGWACLKRIRSELALTALPVVALTAESVDPARALDAGFALCLAKPFRKPALQAVLEGMLETKRAMADLAVANFNSSSSSAPAASLGAPPDTGVRDTSSSSSASPQGHDSLPTSPRSHARVSSALSTLHQATRQDADSANDSADESSIKSKRVSPVLRPLHLEDSTPPVSTTSTPQVTSATTELGASHHTSRSADSAEAVTGGLSLDALQVHSQSHSRSHSRTRSESRLDSPLRPSSRQQKATPVLTQAAPGLGLGLGSGSSSGSTSIECTPSSHRRSLRDAVSSASDRSDSSVSPLQHSTQASSQSRVEILQRRMRGGAGNNISSHHSHSPLGLSASPLNVPRHLIIEPSPHSSRRSGLGAGGGSGSNNNTPSPLLKASSISECIIPAAALGGPMLGLGPGARLRSPAGGTGTTTVITPSSHSDDGRRRAAHAHRKSEVGHVDDSAVPASIPPLHPHPVIPLVAQALPLLQCFAPSGTPSPLGSPGSGSGASPSMCTRALSMPSSGGSGCSSASSGSSSACSSSSTSVGSGSNSAHCRSGSDSSVGSATSPTQPRRSVSSKHFEAVSSSHGGGTLDLSRMRGSSDNPGSGSSGGGETGGESDLGTGDGSTVCSSVTSPAINPRQLPLTFAVHPPQ